jgi:acetate kinase
MLPDVLTVNAGSTSVKLFRRADGRDLPPPPDLDAALASADEPAIVIHRVVHGGTRTRPEVLDDAAVQALRELTELAPLHQPPALDAISRCRQRWPSATQIACFDTSFHASMPAAARTYALPARLREWVQVYGFHGLSHAWATGQARRAVPGARRVLVAHLGGGQSLCGARDGHSVVTTMGFTPVDGLVMATRSGTIDPAAVLYLTRHTGEDLDKVLESESGLTGLAGTGDMRAILDRRRAGDLEAELAIAVWRHRFLRQAGGCIAVLGGLDVLAFTGGIGENSAEVRALVAEDLGWFGVAVRADDAGLATADGSGPAGVPGTADVSAAGAPVRTLVVHAREDLQMIADAEALLAERR